MFSIWVLGVYMCVGGGAWYLDKETGRIKDAMGKEKIQCRNNKKENFISLTNGNFANKNKRNTFRK